MTLPFDGADLTYVTGCTLISNLKCLNKIFTFETRKVVNINEITHQTKFLSLCLSACVSKICLGDEAPLDNTTVAENTF